MILTTWTHAKIMTVQTTVQHKATDQSSSSQLVLTFSASSFQLEVISDFVYNLVRFTHLMSHEGGIPIIEHAYLKMYRRPKQSPGPIEKHTDSSLNSNSRE